MKLLLRPFIKGTNWALTGLLSILGFACSDDGGSDDLAVEYGTPYAKYSIKGAVADTIGTPIPGIEIFIKTKDGEPVDKSNAYTNEQGKFDVTYITFPNEKFTLVAKDIDGVTNGSFKTDSIEVVFSKNEFYEEGDSWYQGAARKEIPTILLKEEEKEAGNEE